MPTDFTSEKPPVLDEPGYDVNEVETYAIDDSTPPVLPDEAVPEPCQSPPSRFAGLKSAIDRSCGAVDGFFERFTPQAAVPDPAAESAAAEWEDDVEPKRASIWGRLCSAAD